MAVLPDDADDAGCGDGAMRTAEFAEAGEDLAQFEHGSVLLHLGCELAQGYGIARPMPAAQMPQWAAQWQPDAAWDSGTDT